MKNLSLAMPTIKVRRGCLFGHYPPRSIKSEYGCYKEWDEEIEASAVCFTQIKPSASDLAFGEYIDQVSDGLNYLGIPPEFL